MNRREEADGGRYGGVCSVDGGVFAVYGSVLSETLPPPPPSPPRCPPKHPLTPLT
jgi:hypothetical protein